MTLPIKTTRPRDSGIVQEVDVEGGGEVDEVGEDMSLLTKPFVMERLPTTFTSIIDLIAVDEDRSRSASVHTPAHVTRIEGVGKPKVVNWRGNDGKGGIQ